MSEKPRLDAMIAAYVKIRNKRSEMKREFEAADEELKGKLDILEVAFLKAMVSSGSDQLKVTGVGLVLKARKEKAIAHDWDAILKYIIQSGAVDMLQRRLALGVLKTFRDDNDGQLPPGTEITTEIGVTVRRA